MGDDGYFAGFASSVSPYRRFGASATILPWAELAARFTEIEGVPYGPASFSGRQSYVDRSVDARLRLLRQGDFWPDVTLGLRDVAGNGLFDAEYLAATGTFDSFEITLGLGWGELASDHMFRNPLAFISGDTRPASGSAGSIRTDYFSGPSMALFGGVGMKTPIDGLSIELEFNSDDYRDDPFPGETHVRASVPLDAGVVYRPLPWLALSAGYERGNTAMVKLALLGNLAEPHPIKGPDVAAAEPSQQVETNAERLSDQEAIQSLLLHGGWRLLSSQDTGTTRYATIAWVGPEDDDGSAESIGRAARSVAHLGLPVDHVALTILQAGRQRLIQLDTRALELAIAETGRTAGVVAAASANAPPPATAVADHDVDKAVAARIASDLDTVGFRLITIELHGVQAIVRFQQDIYRAQVRALGVAGRAVLRDLPPEIALVTFGIVEGGVTTADISMLRHELDAVFTDASSSDELLHHTEFGAGHAPGGSAVSNPAAIPSFAYALRPGLKTDTAGPNGLLLYDLDARIDAVIGVGDGVSISAALAASIASDFDRLKLPSDSVLPHVRSDIADYLRDGKYGIGRLEADVIRQPATDLYARVSAGVLEDMFTGVDAEALYRPYGQNWAVGADINHVWQRGFHERFGLRPYQVTTAVLETFLRTGWYGVTLGVKAGRYLAGDAGGTVELSRTFESGVRIGAFATATTASARQFGEGRFDKGLFVSVPLDWLIGYASRDSFDYVDRPVIRDGGQLIDTAMPLYEMTEGVQPEELTQDWRQVGP